MTVSRLFSARSARTGRRKTNAVIEKFNRLDEDAKQDLLNFLRSL
jgi:hypothetical protein